MADVVTVLGPVSGASLGRTSMHEHLIVDLEHSLRGYLARLDDVELAIEEATLFAEAGGRTIVEVTSKGIGRSPTQLRQIAEATGLNIVSGTGFYLEPYYPAEVYELTVPQLAEVLIRDLNEGMDGTTVRAGIIGEIGTRRRYVSPAEERVFRAAARAGLATGASISTHTAWGSELAHPQIDILLDEGFPADRIIIGHLGDRRDVDYYAAIGERGVYLQFDHVGMVEFQKDEIRATMIAELVHRGLGDRILLACDVCYKSHLHAFGGTGYDHLLTGFIRHLETAGLSPSQVDRILVDNPRRALCGDVPT